LSANVQAETPRADGYRVARPPPSASLVVWPTVVVMAKRRNSRPSAMLAASEPPSDSSTIVAPRTGRVCMNSTKMRGVLGMMAPRAEIHSRQWAAHLSAGPSRTHSKRMAGGLGGGCCGAGSCANAGAAQHNRPVAIKTHQNMRCWLEGRIILCLYFNPVAPAWQDIVTADLVHER